MPNGGKKAPLSRLSPGGIIAGAQDMIARFRAVWGTAGLFSPGEPLVPVEPEKTRVWDFPVGWNYIYTPRSYEAIGFAELRALAENHDITRLAIETRKDQIERLDWHIVPRDPDDVAANADKRIAALTAFWRHPDGELPFATWLREALEDLLVIDAPSFELRRNRGGGIIGLDVIDGATIKVLIDDTGRRPIPPAPAYEQVIHGRPWRLLTADELIYAPRNRRPFKAYGMCYSPDTEILTRRGWLPFTELTLRDEVATRNPQTKAFEWQKPSRVIAEPYDGPMFRFHSRSIDLLVTPEHRMLVTATPRALRKPADRRASWRAASQRWRESNRREALGLPRLAHLPKSQGGEAIVSARDLARTLNPMIKIPMTSVWEGGIEVEEKRLALSEPIGIIEVARRTANGASVTYARRRHRGSEKPLVISGDDYCALMGAYLAEGNLRSKGGIEINQQQQSKGYAAYAQLAARIVGGPAPHNGKAFVLARKGLTEHFRRFGHAHEKFIPDEIMNAPARQIRLFWDHFVLGDGCFEARPNLSRRGRHAGEPATRITTTSRRMAGQLVELAQKLGWSASLRHRRTADQTVIYGRLCNVRDSYVISVRRASAMAVKAEEFEYSGTVHCVSVPNGIVYVRRHGKPAWSGNSPVEQIIMTVNIALRRQVMQLQHFTEGNVPIGLLNAPDNWTAEQIRQFQEWFDASLAGNTAERTKLIWGPAGAKYQAFKEAPYKDDFDEWLARIVCYAFSLPPTAFVRQVNRATADTAQEAALSEGLGPLLSWVKRLADEVMQRRMGHGDLEFVWADQKPINALEQAQVLQIYVKEGIKTRNEARNLLGDDPMEGGNALMLDTKQGPVLLSDACSVPPSRRRGHGVGNPPEVNTSSGSSGPAAPAADDAAGAGADFNEAAANSPSAHYA